MFKFFTVALFILMSMLIAPSVYAGTLSCSVTNAASCSGTVIYRMSGASNAHLQMPGQTNVNYDNNVVCCSGVTGLGNSCSGTYAVALKLDKVTNAHAQINTQTGYVNDACISAPTGGTVSVGYVTDPTTCVGAGYDTTLGTIFSNTNSHVGNTSAYAIKICATAAASTGLSPTGTLTSSVYSTTSNTTSVGYNSIMWKGSLGGVGLNEGKVRFQLAASSSPSGPWVFSGGSTCGSLDWFDPQGPNKPIELKGASCLSSWNNKRYYRYKVQICSNDCVTGGPHTPTVNSIIVNWSP